MSLLEFNCRICGKPTKMYEEDLRFICGIYDAPQEEFMVCDDCLVGATRVMKQKADIFGTVYTEERRKLKAQKKKEKKSIKDVNDQLRKE